LHFWREEKGKMGCFWIFHFLLVHLLLFKRLNFGFLDLANNSNNSNNSLTTALLYGNIYNVWKKAERMPPRGKTKRILTQCIAPE